MAVAYPPQWLAAPGEILDETVSWCQHPVLASRGGFHEPPDIVGGGRAARVATEAPAIATWADALALHWYGSPTFAGLADQARRNRIVCAILASWAPAYMYLYKLRSASARTGGQTASSIIGAVTAVVGSIFPIAAPIGGAIAGIAGAIGAGVAARSAERAASAERYLLQGVDPGVVAGALTPGERCAIATGMLASIQAADAIDSTWRDSTGNRDAVDAAIVALETLATCGDGNEMSNCEAISALIDQGLATLGSDGVLDATPGVPDSVRQIIAGILESLGPAALAACLSATGGASPSNPYGLRRRSLSKLELAAAARAWADRYKSLTETNVGNGNNNNTNSERKGGGVAKLLTALAIASALMR